MIAASGGLSDAHLDVHPRLVEHDPAPAFLGLKSSAGRRVCIWSGLPEYVVGELDPAVQRLAGRRQLTDFDLPPRTLRVLS